MTLRWQTVDPWAGIFGMVSAAFDQRAFRFRNDDGTETTATWKAAQNTAITQTAGVPFRLRIEVQETAGGLATNQTIVLQANVAGTGWQNVGPASTMVQLKASPNVTNQTPTTNQLTAGTGAFVPGVVLTETSGTDISFSGNDHTEVEWAQIIIEQGAVAAGVTVQFRVTINGATANTTSASPSLTVTLPPERDTSGTASGTSTASGSADVISPWAETTSVQVSGVTHLDETVTAGQWYRYRVATSDGTAPTSTFTGWVQAEAPSGSDPGATLDTSGTASGASSTSGAADVLAHAEVLDTSGTVTGSATTSGEADVQEGGGPLDISGAAVAGSSTSATASVLSSTAGTVSGSATTSGAVSASLTASGAVTGASTASGSADIAAGGGTVDAAGTAAGSSTASGAPVVYLTVSAETLGEAATTAALTTFYAIAGTAAGTAELDGTATILSPDGPPPPVDATLHFTALADRHILTAAPDRPGVTVAGAPDRHLLTVAADLAPVAVQAAADRHQLAAVDDRHQLDPAPDRHHLKPEGD
jgi:hypothetical protein